MNQIYHNNGEVDLTEFAIGLRTRKWLILSTTAIAALLSIVYLQLSPVVYRASVMIIPPSPADIYAINLVSAFEKVVRISIEEAFLLGLAQLQSTRTQDSALAAVEHDSVEANSAKINVLIIRPSRGEISKAINGTVIEGDKTYAAYTTAIAGAIISVEHSNATYSRDLVIALANQANKDASDALRAKIKLNVKTKIAAAKMQLAQALLLNTEEKSEFLEQIITNLKLEIAVLDHLPQQDLGSLRVLRLTESVSLPSEPIKPKSIQVVALALLTGLFLGTLLALLSMAYHKQKNASVK